MKKLIFATCLVLSMLMVAPLSAQKTKPHKETKKEKKARIAKWVDQQCKDQTFFVGITRLAPKNGVAQSVVYDKSGYYIDFNKGVFSCSIPYIATKEKTGQLAYNTEDNLYLMAKNFPTSLYGNWVEDKEYYAYKITFMNENKPMTEGGVQIVMTIVIYQSGECIINAQWPGMDNMTYMGELMERPEKPVTPWE